MKAGERRKRTFSIGTDIVEVDRFRAHSFSKDLKFWRSIFFPRELERLSKYSDPYPHAAGIFAAKEAVLKALSFFKFEKMHIRRIEIGKEDDGRPVVVVSELTETEDLFCEVSISHTEMLAFASALCWRP